MHDSSSEEEEEEVPVNVLSKVLYVVSLYSKYTRVLTCENLWWRRRSQ